MISAINRIQLTVLLLAADLQISPTLSSIQPQTTPFSCVSVVCYRGSVFTPFSLINPSLVSSLQTKATLEAVVYHISNETKVIMCIPETAMMHCLAFARDQPLNNVYHCLPRLFNYLANIVDKPAWVSVFKDDGLLFANFCANKLTVRL